MLDGMRGIEGTEDRRFGNPCTPGGAGNSREILSSADMLRISFGKSFSNREAVVGNSDKGPVDTSRGLGIFAEAEFCRS